MNKLKQRVAVAAAAAGSVGGATRSITSDRITALQYLFTHSNELNGYPG